MPHDHRDHPCPAPPHPDSLAAHTDGYSWSRDTVGQSGGAVYRLHGKPGAPSRYIKHGRGEVAHDLADEMLRLRWLAPHVAVPAVRHFEHGAGEAWLLMDAVRGRTAWQALSSAPEHAGNIVDALARFLRRLHAIPAAGCPFSGDRLHKARARLDAGMVDEEDFDEERAGWSAGRVWTEMTALLPLPPEPVVTHGDYSLDNLFLHHGDVAGCIDVGRAGIADRYQDLAILWNCLGEFGPSLQRRLFESYGIPRPDERRLRFHLMLDEFF
jgi:aminoglycoside 3'-phosphotransferase-1